MNRSAFVTAVAAASAASAIPLRARAQSAEDANLTTPTGTLYGTLERPPGTARVPAVLLLPGSGPTDRDGNAPMPGAHFDTQRRIALGLAERGIASVRFDKRGIAASAAAGANEADLRYDMYVADAVGYVRMLRERGAFTRIAIAGHSEGSLIGMLAAVQTNVDGYVSLEGAGRPLGVVLREQLHAGKVGAMTPELLAASDHIIDELSAGRLVPDTPPALAALFRPQIQPFLISVFKYDPAKEIAKVRCAAAIVQGTADIQTPVADGAALHAALPSARYVLVDGMNHVLKHAPDVSSPDAILAGYIDPARPVEPVVIDTIAAVARA